MKIKLKYCPKCGSNNVKWVNPLMWSTWVCYDCGYEGPIIIEDEELAREIRENYLKQCHETSE